MPQPSRGPIQVPDRVRVWRPGRFQGDFGEQVFDETAAAAVMADFNKRGNPIPIDIEHNSNRTANPGYDPGDPPEGGGYALLSLQATANGPELWMTDIRWSDRARRDIESGSRNAISPDWDYDPQTKRPLRINTIALVQNPGTYGIGLIASAGRAAAEKNMDALKMMLLTIKSALESDDPKAILAPMIGEWEKLIDGGADAPLPDTEEFSAADPIVEKDKMAAMARAVLAQAKRIVNAKATASAPADAVAIRDEAVRAAQAAGAAAARQAWSEEAAKASIIASAARRPGMSSALAARLQTLPLKTAREIIEALPPEPVAPPGSGAPQATAGAQPPASGVQTAPLPGCSPDTIAPTPEEQAAINAINRAGGGPTVDQARAAAGLGSGSLKIDPVTGGVSFSAAALRKPTAASVKANN